MSCKSQQIFSCFYVPNWQISLIHLANLLEYKHHPCLPSTLWPWYIVKKNNCIYLPPICFTPPFEKPSSFSMAHNSFTISILPFRSDTSRGRRTSNSMDQERFCASRSPRGTQVSHQKNPLTFHYTGWLIGILIMAYYNPYITGSITPYIH